MKLEHSQTLSVFGIILIAVIGAAFFYSKPATAEPSITVYRSPT